MSKRCHRTGKSNLQLSSKTVVFVLSVLPHFSSCFNKKPTNVFLDPKLTTRGKLRSTKFPVQTGIASAVPSPTEAAYIRWSIRKCVTSLELDGTLRGHLQTNRWNMARPKSDKDSEHRAGSQGKGQSTHKDLSTQFHCTLHVGDNNNNVALTEFSLPLTHWQKYTR